MRDVRITKTWFDQILYPIFVSSSAENESDLETAVRVLRLFKQWSTEKELTEAEQAAVARGTPLKAFRELVQDEVVFSLEEDQYKLVIDRLKKGARSITIAFAEDFTDLLEAFKNAKEIKYDAHERSSDR